MSKSLLLLSNSSMPGQAYLQWPQRFIKSFLNSTVKKVLFIPYAGITIGYDEYEEKVATSFKQMGYQLQSIHSIKNKQDAISEAEAIVIGGGNTFRLLSCLYDHHLLAVIKSRVEEGTPFIGWSAGSNVACPSIKTTNDMPVCEPQSFQALGLVPFQINPHYTELTIPNFGGETRLQRLQEFLELHENMKIIGLPEGALLRIEGDEIQIQGSQAALLITKGKPVEILDMRDNLSYLMH